MNIRRTSSSFSLFIPSWFFSSQSPYKLYTQLMKYEWYFIIIMRPVIKALLTNTSESIWTIFIIILFTEQNRFEWNKNELYWKNRFIWNKKKISQQAFSFQFVKMIRTKFCTINVCKITVKETWLIDFKILETLHYLCKQLYW